MKKLMTLMIFVYLSMISVHCQNLATEKDTSSVTVDTTGLTEMQAYKLLYENQLRSNDAILKTIFYALAGLATAIISVFAGNWWFNEKKVKDVARGIDLKISQVRNDAIAEIREKINNLSGQKTTEINNLISTLTKEANNNLNDLITKFSTFSDQLRTEIRTDQKTLTDAYESRLKSFTDNLASQISTLEKQFNLRSEGIEQKINILDRTLTTRYDSKIDSIESKLLLEIKKLRRSNHHNSAQIAETNKTYSLAFREYLEEVLLDSEIDAVSLMFSLSNLNSALQKANYIWIDEEEKLQELLKKIDGQDDTKIAILERLKTIDIQTFESKS